MATSTSAPLHDSTATTAIEGALRKVWARKLTLGLFRAMLLAVAALLAGMAIAMLIDWLTRPGNGPLRPWLTRTVLLAALGTLLWCVADLLVRARRWPLIASDVDRANPGIQERWSTVTEVDDAYGRGERSHPAMVRQLASEAAAWAPRVAPRQVLPARVLRRPALAAAGALGLLIMPALVDPALTGLLVRRFWAPRADLTLTKLHDVPEQMVVASGESARLRAGLTGRVPQQATLLMRGEEGRVTQLTLDVPTDPEPAVSHQMNELRKPLEFRWQAGDAQSPWTPVHIAQRPRLAEVRVTATAPSYTGVKPQKHTKLPHRMSVIAGSQIEVALKPDVELKLLELDLGAAGRVPLPAGDDGWYSWRTTAEQDLQLTPHLTELQGLVNREPPTCRIRVYQDNAPKVRILSPSPDLAVRPDDNVAIHFSAEDDIALEHAELLVYGAQGADGERPVLRTIPIDLGEMRGQRKARGKVELPLQELALQSGDAISYAVKVYDNRARSTPQADGPALVASSDNASPPGEVRDSPSSAGDASGRSNSDTPPARATTLANRESPDAVDRTIQQDQPSPDQPNRDPSANHAVATAEASPPGAPGEANDSDAMAAANPNSTPSAQDDHGSPRPDLLAGGRADDRREETTGPQLQQTPSQPGSAPEGMSDSVATSDSATQAEGPGSNQVASDSPSAASGAAGEALSPNDAQMATNDRGQAAPASGAGSNQGAAGATPGGAPSGESQRTGEDPLLADDASPDDVEPAADTDATETSATSGEQTLLATGRDQARDPDALPPEGATPEEDQTARTDSNQRSGRVVTPEGMAPLPTDPSVQDSQTAASDSAINPMTQRLVDVPQAASSSAERQLKIDEFAGSFDGQQRDKIAVAVSPALYELDQLLGEAERTTQAAAEQLEAGAAWTAQLSKEVEQCDAKLKRCQAVVKQLQDKTHDTPYAFVGLQLGAVVDTHVAPARDLVWESLEVDDRHAQPVRGAWTEIRNARAKLADLTRTFDRIHREHRLAEDAQRIKKMYQVFIEDAMISISNSPDPINAYERRLAEFDLDEEYLERLREVLEMRRDLQAELARMLRDDPRLMRRLSDSFQRRGETLRDQMTLLAERQKDLAREGRAWNQADEADRAELLGAIARLRQTRVEEVARQANTIKERFNAWLPLDLKGDNTAFSEVQRSLNDVVNDAARLTATPPEDQTRVQVGRRLYGNVGKLDAALRQVNLGREHGVLDTHLLNRLAETRTLKSQVSSWVRQTTLLEAGQYWEEASIEQYKLAMETDALAGKLATVSSQLAAGVTADPVVAEQIAAHAQSLLKTLDSQLSASQLAAVFAMKRDRPAQAVAKQQQAVEAFDKIEEGFDDLMRMVIDELDKVPPQDPIASLLEDPTLDELMALLENEDDPLEALGIPQRPSNLQTIQDWMRPSARGAGSGGGRMVTAYLRRQQQEARRRAELAHQEAIARALKEQERLVRPQRTAPMEATSTDWNQLLSTLPDDLRQAQGEMLPQEYRRMIEQYLSRISRLQPEDAR